MIKMLIADDNPSLMALLEKAARKEGYLVCKARNGRQALDLFETEHPQIVLLDVMMQELDGFEVCRQIRKQSGVPVLMITARSDDYDKIMGLDIGADDYLVKPFSMGELMAHVRAVLRRVKIEPQENTRILAWGSLKVSLEDYAVSIHDQPVSLTKREVEMLYTLFKGRKQIYTREMLLDLLWGEDYDGEMRTVDSHMKRLRAKLDALPHPDWTIKTVRGVGYKFEELPS